MAKGFFKNKDSKKNKKEKKKVTIVKTVETEVAEALEKAKEIAQYKVEDANKISSQNKERSIVERVISQSTPKKVEGKIDTVTGNVYYPLDTEKNNKEEKKDKFVKTQSDKAEDKWPFFRGEQKSFDITERISVKPVVKYAVPIEADITVVCIELNNEIERIEKYIKASLKFYNTKFYKFIFFSDNIFASEIMTKSLVSEDSILEAVKIQKELSSSKKEEVLLYDAIDETVSFTKESQFVGKRIITVDGSKFVLDERKYLFIISGNEKGSCITKKELQKVISSVREKDVDVHVVLTDSNNLSKILPLGFRTIRSY